MCWQGLDDPESVVAPKVLEALLGTRFQGRDFLKSPLVSRRPPPNWLLFAHTSHVSIVLLWKGASGVADMRQQMHSGNWQGWAGTVSRLLQHYHFWACGTSACLHCQQQCMSVKKVVLNMQVLSWGWNDRATLGHGHRYLPQLLHHCSHQYPPPICMQHAPNRNSFLWCTRLGQDPPALAKWAHRGTKSTKQADRM